jgi:hypothetical protein
MGGFGLQVLRNQMEKIIEVRRHHKIKLQGHKINIPLKRPGGGSGLTRTPILPFIESSGQKS